MTATILIPGWRYEDLLLVTDTRAEGRTDLRELSYRHASGSATQIFRGRHRPVAHPLHALANPCWET
jgi:hypothetical protein